ncbi:MAG: winged helix-turn-helix domain-containing protein, partial [Acidobacteria bacterium]|nr:winged helix-turn-helix domain-containing protein [Acidobacteriota bacterium]
QLLELLMRRAGRVVPRDALIDIVWGGESDIEFNTVDAFISGLRRKLESNGQPRLIHTARGIGFSIREPR